MNKLSYATVLVVLSTVFGSCASLSAHAAEVHPCGEASTIFELQRADNSTILPDNDSDETTDAAIYSDIQKQANGQQLSLYCGNAKPVVFPANLTYCKIDKIAVCH